MASQVTNQFPEESALHLAALKAGVKYVVRISSPAANVRPDCEAYYTCTHWTIEALLSSLESNALQWTSLQPNIFSTMYLLPAAEFIKTGEQDTLKLMASKDAPVGVIDPDQVGILAAHLLCQYDPTIHNKAKYVLNGPEDITGSQIVNMVEQHIGTQVKNVDYKVVSFIDSLLKPRTQQMNNVILSVKHAPETAWEGKCTASTTSREVLELAPPKPTPAQVL